MFVCGDLTRRPRWLLMVATMSTGSSLPFTSRSSGAWCRHRDCSGRCVVCGLASSSVLHSERVCRAHSLLFSSFSSKGLSCDAQASTTVAYLTSAHTVTFFCGRSLKTGANLLRYKKIVGYCSRERFAALEVHHRLPDGCAQQRQEFLQSNQMIRVAGNSLEEPLDIGGGSFQGNVA